MLGFINNTLNLIYHKMATLIRKVNNKEIYRKTGYKTMTDAKNAGNSWKRNCTTDQNVRKTLSFKVLKTDRKK